MNCPKCSAPLDSRSLEYGITVLLCPSCYGTFYPSQSLTVPIDLQNVMASSYSCPSCEGKMEVGTVYDGKLTLERCSACKGLWFDPGEIQKLRALSGVEGVIGPPSEVSKAAPVAAVTALKRQIDALRPGAKGEPGGRHAKDDGDGPVKAKDCGSMQNPDAASAPVLTYEGRSYAHFQTSLPVVTFVLGEFTWKAAVGEETRTRDFICPPCLLSEEISGKDIVWTHGEYVEPAEIWEAFKLPGDPPRPSGVSPAQSNPWDAVWGEVGRWFQIFAGAAVLGFIIHFASALDLKVFGANFQYQPAEAEKSRVTEVFELGGHASNVEIQTHAYLNNQWTYLSMALINADTDEALDFGRELSYYSGVDGGEAWSEGSLNDTVYLPAVKPGRYYLRLEPETDTGAFDYTVTVARDVPRPSLLLIALLLLTAPAAWTWWSRSNFETQRWMESDHPRTSSSDDDNDDDDE